jgi:hypothetical protein
MRDERGLATLETTFAITILVPLLFSILEFGSALVPRRGRSCRGADAGSCPLLSAGADAARRDPLFLGLLDGLFV